MGDSVAMVLDIVLMVFYVVVILMFCCCWRATPRIFHGLMQKALPELYDNRYLMREQVVMTKVLTLPSK